jgi:hypothetical protein
MRFSSGCRQENKVTEIKLCPHKPGGSPADGVKGDQNGRGVECGEKPHLKFFTALVSIALKLSLI